jgi:arylsulfatase A-like enzyme
VRNDPSLFASGVGLGASLGIVVYATHFVHELLASRVHRADLAAWAMGGLAVAVLALAATGGALVSALLRPVARRVGPVASFATLAVVVLAGGISAGVLFLRASPEIVDVYGLARLLFGPAAVLAVILWSVVVRLVWRRGGWRGRRAWVGALALFAVVALAWTLSGTTYAASNRVRSVVEQRSLIGRGLVRYYARLADMDGDEHAWAFGGRDCDDFDASVHPGAYDEPGDGVDADCFSGDGSPEVADLGDGHYGPRPRGLPLRPNFVLITIDALRPDHLGAAGYARDTSPNLDRFAAQSVRFETTIAQSSRSLRSIPALMTGHYPSQIAYGPEYLWPALLPTNTTLPEVLKRHGYATAVTMGTDYFHRVAGFFQGFDDVDEILIYKPERNHAVDDALVQMRQLAGAHRPFFQWVHLFNVHVPYLQPPRPSLYGDELVDRYDTEIHLADEQVQRLFDELDRLGIAQSTVVIVASDHGEAFLEHGVNGHCTTLYDEEILATLMMRVPGVAPRVVEGPVALFDLTPTVLNLVGAPVPDPMPARSLVPFFASDAEPDPDRLLFAEVVPDGLYSFDIKMIRRGQEKLHWWVQDGTYQLFDLERDPRERHDQSDARRDDALELLGLLQAWVAETNRPENRTDAFVDEHRLRAAPDPMTHPLDLRFPGLFTVLGCDLPQRELHPGETVDLTCYYRVDSETELDLWFRVEFQVQGPPGYRVPPHFHALHYPLQGRYHTTHWRAGEILADPMPMVIPPEIQTPVDLRITFAVQPGRDQGASLSFQRGRASASSTVIDEIHIRAAPRDAGPARDAGPPRPTAITPPPILPRPALLRTPTTVRGDVAPAPRR